MKTKSSERTDPYARFDESKLTQRILALNYDPSLRLSFERYKWHDPKREAFFSFNRAATGGRARARARREGLRAWARARASLAVAPRTARRRRTQRATA